MARRGADSPRRCTFPRARGALSRRSRRDAAALASRHDARRARPHAGVPDSLVVHDDGSIAGIVAPTDILKALAQGLELRDESTADAPFESWTCAIRVTNSRLTA